MEKVDVAICSYKKPESLIYTIFSLKKHCGDYIDTIYINDDCSNDGTIDFYKNPYLINAIKPIKIKVRKSWRRMGVAKTMLTPRQLIKLKTLLFLLSGRDNVFSFNENDIRYQWAINSTDKKYLFLAHDDIRFSDNIIKLYLETIKKQDNCAIVGDLGQCWKCNDNDKCNPELILQKKFPQEYWPLTTNANLPCPLRKQRACRINEWSCLINVDIARKTSKDISCHFGNCEDGGDTGAYWFSKIVELGYNFDDPLPTYDERLKYYEHCWQGHSGHSVWADQGFGIKTYQREMIKKAIKEEFNYILV